MWSKKLIFVLFLFLGITQLFLSNGAFGLPYDEAGTCSLVEIQSIPTNAASNWESFVIDGETYLAVANAAAGELIYNIDSKIYKWNGSSFIEIQSIPTNNVHRWESFVIDGETYLAVANCSNGSSSNIDSKIYKWNGSSFVEIQSIPTHGACDWESFVIDGETYLVVANNSSWNGSTCIWNIDSKIYKWNGSSFVEIQSIPTNAATDWESFVIGGETYLVVANSWNGSTWTFNTDSKIYKWNGSSFVEIQSIPTNGAERWESFVIDGETYLVVANTYNGSSYNIDSKIYKWNKIVTPPPTANAGKDISVFSESVSTTTIYGAATDQNTGAVLTYRWKEGQAV